MWPFPRAPICLDFPDRVLLPTATETLDFEARLRCSYRPGRRAHRDRDSLVRYEVVQSARALSHQWEADEWAAAQDALNARLGTPRDSPDGYYRRLTAQVALTAAPEAIQAAMAMRMDRATVARLRYLKAALYTDPSLMAIARFHNDPRALGEDFDFDKYRRLAGQLQETDQWWSPILAAWSELAANTKSAAGLDKSMEVLLDALNRLDSRLAARHGLPGTHGGTRQADPSDDLR